MNPTTPDEVRRWLMDYIDETMEETLVVASKIGEDAQAIARKEHLYKAQTGNLQSSVGFALTYNGELWRPGEFEANGGTQSGDEGVKQGAQYLEKCLEQRLSTGVQLTMVAGMDYAGYVEDMGLDVLRSAETHIRNEFDKLAKGTI